MTGRPYLFLDIDGVLHGPQMRYGFERTCRIDQSVPWADVHPRMRPSVSPRRRTPPRFVNFRTRVRVSRSLLADIDALGLDVRMLTTWLEHDSVDTFFAHGPVPEFRYRKLEFPGRESQDELAAIPAAWKIAQLRETMHADPRPFIWVDDAEVPIWREAVEREFGDLPHLLLAPDEPVGLTHEDAAAMRAFVA